MASLQRSGYETVRPTHRCAAGDRALSPGETYVAVLLEPPESEELVRRDYSLEAWESGARPELEPIAVWRAVESESTGQRSIIPGPEELLAMFEGLGDAEAEGRAATLRYLLALMLMRKRVLRLVDQRVGEGGRPVLQLARRGGGKEGPVETFEVVDPGMDEDAIATGIRELGTVLVDGEDAS